MNRRRLLEFATAAIGAAMSAVIAVPLIGYLIAPALRAVDKRKVKLLDDLRQLKPGAPLTAEYVVQRKDGWMLADEVRQALVIGDGRGGVTVFSSICTHAGCSVEWKGTQFFCPCHDGRFDLNGSVVSGPPPRPLVRLPHSIEGNRLYVEVEA